MRLIADAVEKTGLLDAYPNINGVVPIVHGTGCSMSATSKGMQRYVEPFRGMRSTPNFAAALVVGLGCEVMQVANLIADRKLRPDGEVRCMTTQQQGGTRETRAHGLSEICAMAERANATKRIEQPVSELIIGGNAVVLTGIPASRPIPRWGMPLTFGASQGYHNPVRSTGNLRSGASADQPG